MREHSHVANGGDDNNSNVPNDPNDSNHADRADVDVEHFTDRQSVQ